MNPLQVYQGLCFIALGFVVQGVEFTIRAIEEGMAVSVLPMLPWLPSHVPRDTEGLLNAA